MRQIGNLPHQADANRFASYLVSQGIIAHAEEVDGKWSIWVREEDQLTNARDALAEFNADPNHARYHRSEQAAAERLRQENAKRDTARQQTVHMRDRWGGSRATRRRPLTIAVVLLCSIVGLASGLGGEPSNDVYRALMFFDPVHDTEGWEPSSVHEKLIDIRRGEWWRIITPAFLHGGAIHLAFNMVMFYQLGSAIEHRRGTWRLGLMILAIAACSNLAQGLVPESLGGYPRFLGLSGVVYGLLGYVWMKARYQPQLGLFIDRYSLTVLVGFMLLGFVGALRSIGFPVANWAHGMGFAVGVVLGVAPLFLPSSSET